MVSKESSIVLVGAGVFGLSAALELKKRGYQHVTVLDRYLPPVPDSSSVDISRVIRTDYADPLYARMAREAYQGWLTEYKAFYHEPGFVMLAEKPGSSWIEKARDVAEQLGQKIDVYTDATKLSKVFPGQPAAMEGMKAYVNPKGGWADAAASIRHLAVLCSSLGVQFITGSRGRVLSLKYSGARVVGVKTAEGSDILADQVILATGAWTNRLVPITHASSASAQPVGFIRLSEEEANRLEKMPVIINMSTGVFIFPPTKGKDKILKLARHGYGFTTNVEVNETSLPARVVSSPKRDSSNTGSSFLPDDADAALREGLKQLAPEFASREWMDRRLCWYSDTPEGDFVVDHYPRINGLFLATGGAGHAFKFLPVLGKYVVDCFEGIASQELRHKWRLREGNGELVKKGDGSRGGPPLRLLRKEEQAKL